MEEYLVGLIVLVFLSFFIGVPVFMFCCVCNGKMFKRNIEYKQISDYRSNNYQNNLPINNQ